MYYYLPSLGNLLFSMYIAVRYRPNVDRFRAGYRKNSDGSAIFELPDRDVLVGRGSAGNLNSETWDVVAEMPNPAWLPTLLVSVPLMNPFAFKVSLDVMRRGGMVVCDSGGA